MIKVNLEKVKAEIESLFEDVICGYESSEVLVGETSVDGKTTQLILKITTCQDDQIATHDQDERKKIINVPTITD